MRFRLLEKGEIIRDGDEADASVNPMKDAARWQLATNIGAVVPDPVFPSHTLYRRPLRCHGCGDLLTGHEDDSGTHCRWCVQTQVEQERNTEQMMLHGPNA